MIRHEDELAGSSRNRDIHRRIHTMLMRRYDMPVINNVYRGDYVECLVAVALGTDWWLIWTRGWDWAAWDCQHESGARLEVKQAATRQSWDCEALAPRRAPRFDIAPRTGYWTEDGRWVDFPGRPADLYVFAWHDERRDGYAEHRDPNKWLFFVVAEQDLPKNQKHIGLTGLKVLASPCRITELKHAVENASPAREELKTALGHIKRDSQEELSHGTKYHRNTRTSQRPKEKRIELFRFYTGHRRELILLVA